MGVNVIDLHDWRERLQRRANGTLFADERNTLIAFENSAELKGLLAYNEFRDRVILRRELPRLPGGSSAVPASTDWGDEHLTCLTAWLQSIIPVRRDVVQNAVIAVSKSRSFHPVREYLKALVWDQAPRLTSWLKRYLGAKDHAAYLEAVGPKFLIGVVARVFQPGCQMDTMLVLEGNQGLGKSTAVQFLAGRDWARDITGDLSTKDAVLNIQGVWIGEMAELTAIRRAEQEHIKAFISRRIDRYRPPYGRNTVDRPRHCSFVATTNEHEYLQDPTGARRFWPVECTSIDLVGLERDRDQLWAEAVHRYKAAERWHLDATETRQAAVEQDARQRLSPIDCVVLEHLDELREGGLRVVEMRALLADLFDVNTREDPGKAGALAAQVARTLVGAGWKRLKPVGRGQTRRQQYEYKESETPHEPYDPHDVPEPTGSQGSQGSQGISEDIPF